jgi:hypothetical protein
MNPDNPYAAPQTLSAKDVPSDLPLATPAGRQRYPMIETNTLLELARMGNRIQTGKNLWYACLILLVALPVLAERLGTLEIWLALAMMSILYPLGCLRIYFSRGGRFRRRKFLIAADLCLMASLLFFTCYIALKFFLEQPVRELLICACVAAVMTIICCVSIMTLLKSTRLFSSEHFEVLELADEAGYRQRYGIQ